MRTTLLTLLGAALLFSTPIDSAAQNRPRRTTVLPDVIVRNNGRSGDWIRVRDRDGDVAWGRVIGERNGARIVVLRDGRVVVLGDRDRDRDRGRQVRGGQGPSFCRSGAGHPVFGRRWCLERGFGLGRDRGSIWDRRDRDDGSDDDSGDRRDRVRRGDRRVTLGDIIFGDRRGRDRDDDDS